MSAIRPRVGCSSPCQARLPRFSDRGRLSDLHVRIDTLYLGNGGPADPDRIRGVAMLGGRTINVRAISDLYFEPDRSGDAGTGAAGPRAGSVNRLRVSAETKNGRLKLRARRAACRSAGHERPSGRRFNLFDLTALAFGLDGFGGGFLAMGLRMHAEIMP